MAKEPLNGSIWDVMRYARTAAGLRDMTKQSRNWYMKAVKNINKEYDIDRDKNVMVDFLQSRSAKKFTGKLYMYHYKAKTEKTLPYYDRFPLTMIVDIYKDGWTGINFHYLPLGVRFKLFEQLLTLSTDKNYDETTRIKITYAMLKNMQRFKWAKPAFKRYLTSHVKSKMRLVPANEWQISLVLPVQRFKGASVNKVYNDSRRKIK